jgi:hypothetical protein
MDKDELKKKAHELKEEAVAAGKKVAKAAGDIAHEVEHVVEEAGKNRKRDAEDHKHLEDRRGSWKTLLPYYTLFDEISKVLSKPIGEYQISVTGDPDDRYMTATTGWTEYVNVKHGNSQAVQLTINLVFEPTRRDITEVKYEWLTERVKASDQPIIDKIIHTVNREILGVINKARVPD